MMRDRPLRTGSHSQPVAYRTAIVVPFQASMPIPCHAAGTLVQNDCPRPRSSLGDHKPLTVTLCSLIGMKMPATLPRMEAAPPHGAPCDAGEARPADRGRAIRD